MGTTLSDTMYANFAHTAPPSPPHQATYLEKRWLEWLPWATMAARKHPDPASYLYMLKSVHHARLLDLLAAKVTWTTIRTNRLDDPIISAESFEFQLRAAMARGRGNRERTARRKGNHHAK